MNRVSQEALNQALEDAAETPALADFQSLWQEVECVLNQLPTHDKLRIGGAIIEQLAAVYQAKAEKLLDDWENAYHPQDPCLPMDWLQGLVRQSQYVDLTDLTGPIQRRARGKNERNVSTTSSVVEAVPKENILDMLNQVDADTQKRTILSIAHEEDIKAWVTAIAQWFEHSPQPIPLLTLQQNLNWPLVQLWISLLLGNFDLQTMVELGNDHAEEHFYSPHIMVSDGQKSDGDIV